MQVKDLLELLNGKEEYDIEINDEDYFEIDIDEENETINILLSDFDEDDDYPCDFDCENCDEEFEDCRHNPDNAWRYSDYESKDIGDWDVDDHIAAWFDHMMEK